MSADHSIAWQLKKHVMYKTVHCKGVSGQWLCCLHSCKSSKSISKTVNSKTPYPKNKNSKRPCESLADSLPCKALHLDVEELSEVTEPFNHLGCHAAVELDRERTTARNRMSRLGQQDRCSFQRD